MVWKTQWRVLINGNDMSNRMNPYLTSIEVMDKEGTSSDTATLVFNDRDGQCMLPIGKEKVQIALEDTLLFDGFIDEPDWELSRSGGRVLTVSCTSVDNKSAAKSGQSWHKDEANLQEFLQEAATRAGLSQIKIDPTFANISRDYWSPNGMSFMHLGRSLALELGGIFKIRGDMAILTKRGNGKSVSSQELPMVDLIVGKNVRSLKIKPFNGRNQVSQIAVKRFDHKQAKWVQETLELQDSGAAIQAMRFPRADEESSKEATQGQQIEHEHERGSGSASIDLNVTAQAGGKARISGAREGIDGIYAISSVTHSLDREGGAVTSLELKRPEKPSKNANDE